MCSFFLLVCWCTFLLEAVNAQCGFPNTTNTLPLAGIVGGSTIVQLSTHCVASGPELNTYHKAVVALEIAGGDFTYGITEAICDNVSLTWMEGLSTLAESLIVANLTIPCADCTGTLDQLTGTLMSMCSPCPQNCSNFEFGSGNCFGNSTCCPYYDPQTLACTTDCISNNISTESICYPAILLTIDNREYRHTIGQNYYIFDTSQGSSNDLIIECNFDGTAIARQELQTNSFWKVDFDDSDINSQLQNSSLQANLTNTPISAINVNVSFIANNITSQITFDPMFQNEFTGLFQCHSTATAFNVMSPVSVNVTAVNPLFEYSGVSVFDLVFPVTSFNITGLIAEYRYNGLQRMADSELMIYYIDEGLRINGGISLIDAIERTYTVVFTESLPYVVEVIVEFYLFQELGTTQTIALTVNSHGLMIIPSSLLKVPVGSKINAKCNSLVPGVTTGWSAGSNGVTLVISNIMNSNANNEYYCEVIDEVSAFPVEAESSIRLTLLVFPSPVSIRISDSSLFLPQPTLYSAPFESPNVFSVTCNGLGGHGQLQWTTDYIGFNTNLSLLSSVNGSIVSSGPDELTLSLTSTGYSNAEGNFTCTSGESGLSASIFLPGVSRYLAVIDSPMSPVSIGQTANITYLAAHSAEGYNNNGQVNFQITFIGLEEEIIPSSVIQQSLINPFIYIWTFTVSSLYNTTIIISFGNQTQSVTITVADPPTIDIVSTTPFRGVARDITNLKCHSSDQSAVISWFEFAEVSTMLNPPFYNTSQLSEGISTLTFIPYIFDIYYFLYPPVDLLLSDIVPVDINSINIPNEMITLTCTVCDANSLVNPQCIMIDPQMLTFEPLFHPVTWTHEDNSLYNGSIRNRALNNLILTCKSTPGNRDLGVRTENQVLSQFFSTIDFNQQQLFTFFFSNGTSVSVTQVTNNDIIFRINGSFIDAMNGDYVCFSRESNTETTILLTTDAFFVEFLVPPTVSHTLGTEVLLPYRAASLSFGYPIDSRGSDAFPEPFDDSSNIDIYEISPFNYIIYIPTLGINDGGNYTVSINNDGQFVSPRTVLLQIDIPTINVPNSNVTTREGESVTVSCVPSDPRVQLTWSSNPLFFESDVVYDSELRHSLTVVNPRIDTTYYCQVKGQSSDSPVISGLINVNVLTRCDQSLQNGILSDTMFEGDNISLSCNDVSQMFTKSSFVRVTRECLSTGLLSTQFSTCTLAKGTENAFGIIDISVYADNITVVQENEALILTDVRNLLGANTLQITNLYITRYVQYGEFVGIVLEAIFAPEYVNIFSLDQLFFSDVFAGFLLGSFDFEGFQPSNSCECRTFSFVSPSPSPSPLPLDGPQNDNVVQNYFYNLCVGINAEPCVCSIGSCKCQSPFVGDGSQCTIDSDSDGYPDIALEVDICNEFISDLPPLYCINDTCPLLYNPEQNPPICNVTVPGGCSVDVDTAYTIDWPSVSINTTVFQSCGDANVIGLASRFCGNNGEWSRVNASKCVSRSFQEIFDIAVSIAIDPTVLDTIELYITSSTYEELLIQLVTETDASNIEQGSLFPTELSISNDVLTSSISILFENLERTGNTSNINATAFGDVLSNLLDIRNDEGWESLQEEDSTMGSELLLDNAEDFGLLLANSLGEDVEMIISNENIIIHAQQVMIQPDDQELSNIYFPDLESIAQFTNSEENAASINIPSGLLIERGGTGGNLPVVNILFNNLQQFLEPANRNESASISSGTLILSSQVGKQNGTSTALVNDPVVITFQIIPENFSDPYCVFWEFSVPAGNGVWSSSGIKTIINEDSVICLSQHLTSFAVLVDTTGVTTRLTAGESLALSIVTYIGLCISIFCLVLTIIFFLTFGMVLFTKVHNLVHLNLAISLLLAYLVFIGGIQTATANKAACTLVAALLHYFFLSAFCWMLCEGLMLYLMLVVVFSTLSKKWWFFLLLGWLPPLIPVIITVGITHDYYTDGEDFCWLSVEKHVIWAFVIPMIVIILINIVFYIMVMYSLIKNKGAKNAMKMEENKAVEVVKSTIKGSLVLLPLLGLTWVFGLLAVVQQTTVFAWIFTILNAFQGAAIFFFHVVRNDRIWNRITKQLSGSNKDYSSSEHSSNAFEKKRKYFTPKGDTATTSTGTYSKSNDYELELAPVEMTDHQEPDIEKEKPIETEYVQVGDTTDHEKKIDISNIDTMASEDDPHAPLKVVDIP